MKVSATGAGSGSGSGCGVAATGMGSGSGCAVSATGSVEAKVRIGLCCKLDWNGPQFFYRRDDELRDRFRYRRFFSHSRLDIRCRPLLRISRNGSLDVWHLGFERALRAET